MSRPLSMAPQDVIDRKKRELVRVIPKEKPKPPSKNTTIRASRAVFDKFNALKPLEGLNNSAWLYLLLENWEQTHKEKTMTVEEQLGIQKTP